MKKIILCILVSIFWCTQVWSQDTFIPINVKGKFGISDEAKNILVKPIYHKIDFNSTENYFRAFHFSEEKKIITSLIFKDKVILHKKPYFDYRIIGELIIAVEKTAQESIREYSNFHFEKKHLYNKEGELLIDDYFSVISVFNRFSELAKYDEVLVLLQGFKDKNLTSIAVYDKRKGKITKTLVSNVKNLEFVYFDTYMWMSNGLEIKYEKIENIITSTVIKVVNNSFEIVSEDTLEKTKTSIDEDFYGDEDSEIVPDFDRQVTQQPTLKTKDSISKTLQYIIATNNAKNLYEESKVVFRKMILRGDNYSIGFKKNKIGLIDIRKGEYVVEPTYDEIYKMIEKNVFILKKGKKYGLYFPYLNKLVKPTFKDIPIVTDRNFSTDKTKIIKFYNAETKKFKCYGNIKGELYYLK